MNSNSIPLLVTFAIGTFFSHGIHILPTMGKRNPAIDPRCSLNDHHHKGLGNWSAFRDTMHPYPYVPHSSLEHIAAHMAPSASSGLVGRHECQHSATSKIEEPLWTRSLCPWYWKENYDPDRIPQVLLEAHCRCDKTIVTMPGPNEPRAKYECEKVYYKVRVLKLDKQCGYYATYEDVSFACTTIVSTYRPAFRGHMIKDDSPEVEVK